MSDSKAFIFEHPVAQRLADLAGIEHDLELTIKACDLFLTSQTDGTEEALLNSRALATFAVITYFRTVATGFRGGVTSAQIESLDSSLRLFHTRLKAMRDQYLAHSISQHEVNSVRLKFQADSGELETIGTMHSRQATFSTEEITSLKTLAERLHEIISKEYDSESDKVWDLVTSLPKPDLQKALTAPKSPYPSLSSKKQRRFSNKAPDRA